MGTFVIGDIHGGKRALVQVLERAEKNKSKKSNSKKKRSQFESVFLN